MELLLASVFVLACSPSDDGMTPVAPVEQALTELGRVVDIEGDWMATLQILPIPEHQRAHHAPRPPWKLGRVRRSGLEPVEVTESGVTQSGWGAPQFVAVGADGTLALTWRPGRHLVLFSPEGTRTDLTLELPYELWCAHLEPDGVVHSEEVGKDRFQLTWRAIDAIGASDPIDLGVTSKQPGVTATQFLRDDEHLYWIRGEGELASLDIDGREVKVIPCAGIEHFTLDAIHDGTLFAHSNEDLKVLVGARSLARLVELQTGHVFEQPAPSRIATFTPYGWLTSAQWIDPVEGTRGTLERPISAYDRMLQVDDRTLWTGGRRERFVVSLRLDGTAVPPADNAAAMASIEQVLAGDRTKTMRGELSRLTKPYSDECVALLDRVARDFDDTNDRRTALRMLGTSRHRLALNILVRHLADEPNWWDRMTTVGALADLGDPTCVPAILTAMPVEELHGDYAGRIAGALAVLGNGCATDYLDRLFERTKNERVGAARERLAQRLVFIERLRKTRD